MQRATKIVATLGPASSTQDVLNRMLAAGVDVVRLNFSHGAAADHEERARLVRDAARSLGREVAIMADLQGPKIRIGKLANGTLLQFEKIYPLDAAYDVLADAPEDVRTSKRYKDVGDFSVAGLAARLVQDFGDKPVDIVVHSLANSPEVKRPLLETSRAGYLTAVGVSAYSLVSLVARLGPLMRPGGSFLSLTYMASERVVPGYGGGMSSAKAALESDTRTLAFEAGRRYGLRVNTISAGPLASRAASAIGKIEKMVDYYAANAPLTQPLTAREVGTTAAFLASPLASGITGTTIYVDKGYHAMGVAVTAGDII